MSVEADAANAVEAQRLESAIQIENVTFGYQRGKELLKGVSATIQAGTKVAFVGPPGAGKAALMDLLPRLFDPISGTITWDGTDLKSFTRSSLRRQLGVLSQEQYIFNVPIYDNIRYGRVDATEEEIVAAARTAGLHEFIQGLPAGYDTQVNDRDTSLGLPIRQRIAVARLLLQPCSVVLMDEALSAIDAQGQRQLEEAIRSADGKRTLIKIAQRVSALTDYDQIYVMDDGKVVEDGQHADLTDRGGLYTQLVKDELGEGAVSGAFAAVRRLAKQAPFSLLSPEILEEVARLMLYAERGPGDIICRQGTVGDELYFVGKGEVEVLIQHEDGHEQILGFINEGEYFGEISFLRRVPRTATCRAHDNVELHILRRQDFDQLLDRLGSDITAHLDRTAQERLEATRAQLSAAESVGSAR
jgi:ATP-binding cassette subfamily B protein